MFEAVGGMTFFVDLADRFYDSVETDAEFVAIYPTPEDLTGARRRLALFLAQYWGGPTTYSDERGHPRLRMRHVPYVIDADARDTWMRHMTVAVDGAPDLEPELRQRFMDYFTMAADHLINAR